MRRVPRGVAAAYIWALVLSVALLMQGVSVPLRLLRRLGKDPQGRLHDAAARLFWGRAVLALNPFWKLDLQGTEHLRQQGPLVLVPNHQSVVDVLLLQGLPVQLKWVTSERFFRVPLLGGQMRASGFVGVDPRDLGSVRRMDRAVQDWLKRGVSMVLFPEGTRSADGEVKEFRVGPFRLAREARATLLPVVIDGTREALPKGALLPLGRPPWTLKVRILGPVPAHEVADLEPAVCARRVRERVRGALQGLRSDAGPEEGPG